MSGMLEFYKTCDCQDWCKWEAGSLTRHVTAKTGVSVWGCWEFLQDM